MSCVCAADNLTEDVGIFDNVDVEIDDFDNSDSTSVVDCGENILTQNNQDSSNSSELNSIGNNSKLTDGQNEVENTIHLLEKTYDEHIYDIYYNESSIFKINIGESDIFCSVEIRNLFDNHVGYSPSFDVKSDANGFITFKIPNGMDHTLYYISVIYIGGILKWDIEKDYGVYLIEYYGANGYKNAKLANVNALYNQHKSLKYGWDGIFTGFLKYYKGNTVVYSIRITADDWNNKYSAGTYFLPTGTYKAKLIDSKGNIAAQSTIKIQKTTTRIKVSSITAKPGTTKYISADVYDKSCNGLHNGGKVKFRINGKNYYVKVKEGTAKIKIKVPSKLKTYTCKATFLGDNNAKSSSTTFKMTVKKVSTKKKTNSFTVVVPTKLNQKISKSYGNYKVQTYKWIDYGSSGKAAHLRIDVFKNGKKLTNYKAKYYVHYSSGGGVWIYTDNYGGTGYKKTEIGYDNVLDAYKVTVTVWP